MSDAQEPPQEGGELIWPSDPSAATDEGTDEERQAVDASSSHPDPAQGTPGPSASESAARSAVGAEGEPSGSEPDSEAAAGVTAAVARAASEPVPEPASSEPDLEAPPAHEAAEQEWTPGEHDLIPLLPRGTPLFDGIPAEALVLEALCPAITNGAIIVRRPDAVGVILVKDGGLFEKYAFQGNAKMLGDGALAEINGWQDALVSAYRFDPLIVAVAPSLLRGDPLYEDLRLTWADWDGLLTDLCSRDGSYVVELDTPLGRGVTCILDGRQVATYTDSHPEFGDATLLNPLAATRRGTIWVRREPSIAEEAAAELAAAGAPGQPAAPWQEDSGAPEGGWPTEHAQPESPRPWEASYVHAGLPWQPPAAPPYGHEPHPPSYGPQPAAAYPGPQPAGEVPAPNDSQVGRLFEPPSSAPRGPSQLAELAPELKMIARSRLQRSAARVETMIDEAVADNHSLDAVLNEIRGLVIRGVMQSTLDEVVDDMAARAGRWQP